MEYAELLTQCYLNGDGISGRSAASSCIVKPSFTFNKEDSISVNQLQHPLSQSNKNQAISLVVLQACVVRIRLLCDSFAISTKVRTKKSFINLLKSKWKFLIKLYIIYKFLHLLGWPKFGSRVHLSYGNKVREKCNSPMKVSGLIYGTAIGNDNLWVGDIV